MAVFYKYIKGCTESANLTSGNWTYIKWTDSLPELYVSTNGKDDSFSNTKNYGTLITNNTGKEVTIKDDWSFIDNTTLSADKLTINSLSARTDNINVNSSINFVSQSNFNAAAIFKNSATFDSTTKFSNEVTLTSSATITSGTWIKATHFIATSDVRAKENVQPWEYYALDLVNKIPVYSFNYKSDQDRVVSILAQDLLENQPKNLDLVNDKDANGIDQFMSIKSDKLTFVLWKAVQELSDRINQLELELQSLKNK